MVMAKGEGKIMRNPLNKRLLRELKGEFSKYLVIFLFMTLTIGFISGFLVAGNSMIAAYDESFEKYQIEDGHFILKDEAAIAVLEDIEQKEHVKISSDYYKEEEVDNHSDRGQDSTIRIFKVRKEMNRICLMDGKMPEKMNEIAVDRMYAQNNGIETGDTITICGQEFTVSALVALSDYSALFSDNNDLMFDSIKFGVAAVTKEAFEGLSEENISYNYSWRYNSIPENENKEREMADAFIEALAEETAKDHIEIETVVPRYANQAINFTGDDMGSDKTMMIVLLYILIVILAFVFSVTIKHTITKEAAVIGTLRASGYTKGELLRHYLKAPMIVTFISAVFGNILGYTVFKNVAADMYYNSYSLPTFHVLWNAEAFVLTTVVPLFIMMVTNFAALVGKLKLSPLKFLRRDLGRKRNRRAVPLPNLPFFHRFRMRIILQNISGYFMLFIGIMFAGVLLLFGMMMGPLLEHYQTEVLDSMPAKYQYILKTQIKTDNEQAEPFCMNSLTYEGDDRSEEITVYGIIDGSKYFTEKLPEEGVCISDGFAEKYQLKLGDTICLKEAYDNGEYSLVVKKIVNYPGSLAVFMTNQMYMDTFDIDRSIFDIGYTDIELLLRRLAEPDDGQYYNGYFSNEEITDIDEKYISACITEDDMTKVSRQLNVSMGSMFEVLKVFAVVMAALLIYLLTKLILERNSTSISMVKILGYGNKEVARLYLLATSIVVVISSCISLALATWVIMLIYRSFMMGFGGWLDCYFAPWIYPEMMIMLSAAYAIVAVIQFRKIQKIPMDEALKNAE